MSATTRRKTGPNAHAGPSTYQPRRIEDVDDNEKGEDELELEEALFGRKRKRVGIAADQGNAASFGLSSMPAVSFSHGDDQDADSDDVEEGMAFLDGMGDLTGHEVEESDLPDDQLFFIDNSLPNRREAGQSSSESESEAEDGTRRKPRRNTIFNADGQSDDEESQESEREEEEENSQYSSDDDSDAESSRSSTVNPFAKSAGSKSTQTKQVLWHDPADDQVRVDLAADNRLRKLAKGKAGKEAVVNGKGLESRLREQFQKMHPSPAWASKEARTDAKSTQSKTTLETLLSSTESFIAKAVSRGALPKSSLDIERLRDANYQARTAEGEKAKKGANGKGQQAMPGGVVNGGVADVKFHPNVEVLSVIGGDRRLRLFTIDGHTNPSLLNLHIASLPLKNAQFHPSGTALLLTGPRPYYYTFDLRSQRCLRSPETLFGGTAGAKNRKGLLVGAGAERNLEKAKFSPDGSVLAIAGRRGQISLFQWGPGGASQLITTINSGKTGGVKDLAFMGREGKELWVLGGEAGTEVDIWDLGQRQIIKKWKDEGGFGGHMLRSSKNGEYCAIGATTGVVNVYDTSEIASQSGYEQDIGLLPITPKPMRELMNLTTSVSTLAFNHDAQIMAIGSDKKKDAFRMIHLPSATAFSNWPTSSTPLGTVTSADFSAGSEYVAIGNTKGKVLLYGLKHYRGT
ncbi:hypothetical protein QFC19_001367 [Naganishia cerealis]|uniref:Uncharacterized protein n=1 Tax=Naganishia cerealis TaxID=610337 RepID=A0ACC2WGI9_9TREE|nr:hypothetical protein QFC19_001367 [Naganishia cerealis]